MRSIKINSRIVFDQILNTDIKVHTHFKRSSRLLPCTIENMDQDKALVRLRNFWNISTVVGLYFRASRQGPIVSGHVFISWSSTSNSACCFGDALRCVAFSCSKHGASHGVLYFNLHLQKPPYFILHILVLLYFSPQQNGVLCFSLQLNRLLYFSLHINGVLYFNLHLIESLYFSLQLKRVLYFSLRP